MVWYRMHGMMVHMRGTKLPPACVGRIESTNQIAPSMRCMAPSSYLCDWPVEGGKTCDAPLCDAHATEVGKDRHYCPRHLAQHRKLVA
jgi:hypothetical protein